MRGLFVESCGPEVTLPLWDLYLLNEDPFLVFFLALVMVLNARDPVMEMGDDTHGVVELLQSMPTVRGWLASSRGRLCAFLNPCVTATAAFCPSSFRSTAPRVFLLSRPA